MMQALAFLGGGRSAVIQAPMPVPQENELLLRVAVSALCGSEKADYMGQQAAPFLSGHEYAGVVQESRCGFAAGTRVVVRCVKGCGTCYFCRTEQPQFCGQFMVYHGGHAAYVCVDASCAIPIPDNMPFEDAVLLGGDTAGVAFRAVKQLRNGLGNTVLVLGAGPIGLGVISFLRYFGYRVLVVEQNAYRREFVCSRFGLGADAVLDSDLQASNEAVRAQTNGLGADAVIECTGNAGLQRYALSVVRCGGQVVLCGENYGTLELVPSHDIIHKEVTLSGAFYYTKADFEAIQELYWRGYCVSELVSHVFAPEDAPQACAMFFAGQTAKVLIRRNDEGLR